MRSPYDGMSLVPFRVQREFCSAGRRWPEQMTSPRATFPQTPAPTFSLFILRSGFASGQHGQMANSTSSIRETPSSSEGWTSTECLFPHLIRVARRKKSPETKETRCTGASCRDQPRREPRRGVSPLTSFCLCLISDFVSLSQHIQKTE